MNPSHPDRRGFVSMLGALAAATALGPAAAARPRAKVEYKLSLAEWSLHNALQKGELDHLDFPRASKRDYGIDTVEYVNTFFEKGATDFGYLGELKKRCADEGVKSRLIMCDGEGSLGAADEASAARRSRTTSSGSPRPPTWAAWRSASTPPARGRAKSTPGTRPTRCTACARSPRRTGSSSSSRTTAGRRPTERGSPG
jgi:hypothetical protein